ncbi:hypothetical protein ScPMuIL_015170 [Solemya velum]
MLTNLFSAMLLFSGISLVRGYSQGAPAQQQVCYQRTPGHQNTMAQQSQAPFQIIVTPNYYVPCQTAQQCMPITVTIRSGGQMGMVGGMTQGMMGYNFMGFMVQAKTMQPTNQQASPSYGQFAGDGQTSKLLNCGNMGQAITHTSNYNKNQVTFRWRPQPGLNGPIVFMGTVVLKFDTYWTNVMSQQIMPRQGMGQNDTLPNSVDTITVKQDPTTKVGPGFAFADDISSTFKFREIPNVIRLSKEEMELEMIEKQTIQAEISANKLLLEKEKLELEKTKLQLEIEQLKLSIKDAQRRG